VLDRSIKDLFNDRNYLIGKNKVCNYSIGKVTLNQIIHSIKWLTPELENLYCWVFFSERYDTYDSLDGYEAIFSCSETSCKKYENFNF